MHRVEGAGESWSWRSMARSMGAVKSVYPGWAEVARSAEHIGVLWMKCRAPSPGPGTSDS